MNNQKTSLSPLAQKFSQTISYEKIQVDGGKVSVDPVVSEVASFYEKIRNAMEYQEEEVVLRVAIERILKRRLLLGSNGFKIAEPLVKELAWAKYFPDKSIPESLIEIIAKKINLYIRLFEEAPKIYDLNKNSLHEWIINIMTADIALIISPNRNTQIIAGLMYHIMQGKINITDDDKEDKNAIIFLNIRRAFAKEDKAFLQYHLFQQYFGSLTEESFDGVLKNFLEGYLTIEDEFRSPLNEQVYSYVKNQTVAFVILKKILDKYKFETKSIIENPDQLKEVAENICQESYDDIRSRVKTAIIRSIIFLIATKAIFAVLLESTVENQLYGHVSWGFLIINIATAPFLMFLSMFFIKVPGESNTKRILEKLNSILYDPNVAAIEKETFSTYVKKRSVLNAIFISLWLIMFIGIIWGITSLLNIFQINFISQAVFVFFLVIVSFLMFRINQSSKVYNSTDKEGGVLSILFYFAFMPFVLLGKRLTLSFSKINIFLLVFDFIIETPFKTVFGFFDQWFTFMRSQRVKLD